jgi:hypothetical protein
MGRSVMLHILGQRPLTPSLTPDAVPGPPRGAGEGNLVLQPDIEGKGNNRAAPDDSGPEVARAFVEQADDLALADAQ